MKRQYPVLSAYSLRDGFDYLEYFEQQSHFDNLAYEIDRDVARLVLSQNTVGERLASSMDKVGYAVEDLTQQMAVLSANLSDELSNLNSTALRIEDSLERIHLSIENGFDNVVVRLDAMTGTLEQLLEISSSPEQTWAYEQFDIARDLASRGLPSEAIESINRAISGYGDHTGYPYDHRLHMLKGLLHFGAFDNTAKDVLDLKVARNGFAAAAKYAVAPKGRHDNHKKARIEAKQMLAWVRYLEKDLLGAEETYRDALAEDDNNPKSWYYLSKTQFASNKASEAQVSFSRAIELDSGYSISAGRDSDFLSHKSEVLEVINKIRLRKLKTVERELSTSEIIRSDDVSRALKSNGDESYKSDVRRFTELIPENFDLSLADLAQLEREAYPFLGELKVRCETARQSALRELEGLKIWLDQYNTSPDSLGPKIDTSDTYKFTSSFAAVMLIAFMIWGFSSISGPVDAFFSILFMIPFGAAVVFIALLVSYPFAKMLNISMKQRQRDISLQDQQKRKIGRADELANDLAVLNLIGRSRKSFGAW